MLREEAFQLADQILIASDPEATFKLRPVLAEALGLIKAPRAHLIARAGPKRTAYALVEEGLFVVRVETEPPDAELSWFDLSEVRLKRTCDAIEGNQSGIWWTITWTLTGEGIEETIIGREGPEFADEEELFARAVAEAAGWPIASAQS